MSIRTYCFRGLGIATGITWVLGAVSSSFSQEMTGAVSSIGLLLSLASWVAAVFVWSKLPERTVLNYVSLPILVLFGFLVGWVYLLFRSGVLSDNPQPKESVADGSTVR